jgi:hypothetical protein
MEAKMDGRQEEMKAQMGSLASRIDANQEDMRAGVSAIQYKMEVAIKRSQEETRATIHSNRSE